MAPRVTASARLVDTGVAPTGLPPRPSAAAPAAMAQSAAMVAALAPDAASPADAASTAASIADRAVAPSASSDAVDAILPIRHSHSEPRGAEEKTSDSMRERGWSSPPIPMLAPFSISGGRAANSEGSSEGSPIANIDGMRLRGQTTTSGLSNLFTDDQREEARAGDDATEDDEEALTSHALRVAEEMATTQADYVAALRTMLTSFRDPLRSKNLLST